MLRSNGIDLTDAAWKLSSVVPKIISVELSTGASRNVLSATLAVRRAHARARAVCLPPPPLHAAPLSRTPPPVAHTAPRSAPPIRGRT